MKLDAITVAAVAVAGLAVATWARSRSPGTAPAGQFANGITGGLINLATAQRRASGAAIPQNTAYLEFWDSPVASTIYSNGSLGD